MSQSSQTRLIFWGCSYLHCVPGFRLSVSGGCCPVVGVSTVCWQPAGFLAVFLLFLSAGFSVPEADEAGDSLALSSILDGPVSRASELALFQHFCPPSLVAASQMGPVKKALHPAPAVPCAVILLPVAAALAWCFHHSPDCLCSEGERLL